SDTRSLPSRFESFGIRDGACTHQGRKRARGDNRAATNEAQPSRTVQCSVRTPSTEPTPMTPSPTSAQELSYRLEAMLHQVGHPDYSLKEFYEGVKLIVWELRSSRMLEHEPYKWTGNETTQTVEAERMLEIPEDAQQAHADYNHVYTLMSDKLEQ